MAEFKEFYPFILFLFIFFLIQLMTEMTTESFRRRRTRRRSRARKQRKIIRSPTVKRKKLVFKYPGGGRKLKRPKRVVRGRRRITRRKVIRKGPPVPKSTTVKGTGGGDIVINIRGMVKREGHMPEIVFNDKPPASFKKSKEPAPTWGTVAKKENHMPKIIINDYPVKNEKPVETPPNWGVFAGKKEKLSKENANNPLFKFVNTIGLLVFILGPLLFMLIGIMGMELPKLGFFMFFALTLWAIFEFLFKIKLGKRSNSNTLTVMLMTLAITLGGEHVWSILDIRPQQS